MIPKSQGFLFSKFLLDQFGRRAYVPDQLLFKHPGSGSFIVGTDTTFISIVVTIKEKK
jgi:hypothetical protein